MPNQRRNQVTPPPLGLSNTLSLHITAGFGGDEEDSNDRSTRQLIPLDYTGDPVFSLFSLLHSPNQQRRRIEVCNTLMSKSLHNSFLKWRSQPQHLLLRHLQLLPLLWATLKPPRNKNSKRLLTPSPPPSMSLSLPLPLPLEDQHSQFPSRTLGMVCLPIRSIGMPARSTT
jgi:hypothetical protein